MPVEYDKKNAKPFEIVGETSEMGRSSIDIICPFCKTEFVAYIWSLCGGGKKCPSCGAMHYRSKTAAQVIKKPTNGSRR